MLLSDLDYGASRVKAFDCDRATEAQQDTVDLLEEARETTIIRPLATSRLSIGTTKEKSEGESSRLETSCFEGLNQPKKNTNSLCLGKYPIW